MSDRLSNLVFHSPLVRVFDVTCSAPRSEASGNEWCSVTQIVVPRRGVFMLHHRGKPIIADPNTALVFGAGDTYQFSHPVDGGDQCTVFVFRPELVEEALGSIGGRYRTIHASTQLRIHILTHMMANRVTDQLEAEESAVLVLSSLAEDFRPSPLSGHQQVNKFQQQRVEEVRALLASQPTDTWHLESIAQAVYSSPFHLTRQFRAVTGESITRYLLRIRLALALDRLAQGETELARLAVDLGSAHHSHFSARFKSVFGTTPTAVRNILTHRGYQQMSKIVTVRQRDRC